MPKHAPRPKSSNYPYLIGLLIGLLLLIVIALQNSEAVTLKLLAWEFDSHLSMLLTLFFAIGFIIGLLTSMINLYRKDRIIQKQVKQIENQEEEIEELRKHVGEGY